jgi:sulfatase modifying factor 1
VFLAALTGCGGRVTDSPTAEAGSDTGAASSSGSEAGLEGGSANAPSCQAGGDGLTNCGPNAESCCTSLNVVGGTYHRTYTNSGTGPTREADPASVSGFRLDKYLVTVGRFRQFVNAVSAGPTPWRPPAGSGKHAYLNAGRGLANGASAGTYESGWVASGDSNIQLADFYLTCNGGGGSWTALADKNERLPMGCETWWEAYAFCIWDGGFLPSEAEWEYAAAGGSEQREYAWGSTNPGTSNQYAIYGCNYPGGSGVCSSAPVGTATLGAGRWGQLDLAGETYEWTLDSYNGEVYVNPCADCALRTSDSAAMMRGSNLDSITSELLSTNRVGVVEGTRSAVHGVRCARAP